MLICMNIVRNFILALVVSRESMKTKLLDGVPPNSIIVECTFCNIINLKISERVIVTVH